MSKSRSSDLQALILFGRYPRLGQVKTRLQKRFPPAAVLALYEAFLLDTLGTVLEGSSWQTLLYLADSLESERASWRLRHQLPKSLTIHPQQGKDLGERLWNACQSTFLDGFSRVVFIGADTPGLPLRFLDRSFSQLCDSPVVLGPVPDGGYYLLGLSEPRETLFREIDWGSEQVLAQTVAKLSSGDFQLLPEWNDVDEAEDLADLAERLQSEVSSPAPRTARILASLLTG